MIVSVLLPRHVQVFDSTSQEHKEKRGRIKPQEEEEEGAKELARNDDKDAKRIRWTFLFIHHDGVVWRGLYPLLFCAPRRASRRVLEYMIEKSGRTLKCALQNKGERDAPSVPLRGTYHSRKFHRVRTRAVEGSSLAILLVPPTVSPCRYSSVTASFLFRQRWLVCCRSLSAWWATLGGGYFFCRRLSHSLELARWQRRLAVVLGDEELLRTSRLHESYNRMYAGEFEKARNILYNLLGEEEEYPGEEQAGEDPDEAAAVAMGGNVFHNQCRAALLLCRRLKQVAEKRGSEGIVSATVDDLQRVRVVPQRAKSRKAK